MVLFSPASSSTCCITLCSTGWSKSRRGTWLKQLPTQGEPWPMQQCIARSAAWHGIAALLLSIAPQQYLQLLLHGAVLLQQP